jgi:hypothetical protein
VRPQGEGARARGTLPRPTTRARHAPVPVHACLAAGARASHCALAGPPFPSPLRTARRPCSPCTGGRRRSARGAPARARRARCPRSGREAGGTQQRPRPRNFVCSVKRRAGAPRLPSEPPSVCERAAPWMEPGKRRWIPSGAQPPPPPCLAVGVRGRAPAALHRPAGPRARETDRARVRLPAPSQDPLLPFVLLPPLRTPSLPARLLYGCPGPPQLRGRRAAHAAMPCPPPPPPPSCWAWGPRTLFLFPLQRARCAPPRPQHQFVSPPCWRFNGEYSSRYRLPTSGWRGPAAARAPGATRAVRARPLGASRATAPRPRRRSALPACLRARPRPNRAGRAGPREGSGTSRLLAAPWEPPAAAPIQAAPPAPQPTL